MFSKFLSGTTSQFHSLIIGAIVAFLLLGSVPNFEINGTQIHGFGSDVCAESASVFPNGPCSGDALAWVWASVFVAVVAFVGGSKSWQWGKKQIKLTTPLKITVGWIGAAIGVLLLAYGGVMLIFSFLVAGDCISLIISDILS